MTGLIRRTLLLTASSAVAGLAAAPVLAASDQTEVDADEVVRRVLGLPAAESPRVRIDMPSAFGNGYSVPMKLSVESEMTEDEHVRAVHVLAPLNPIMMVATFRFSPRSGRAEVATRIRLAKSQDVVAVAEMSDGSALTARTRVEVEIDGCA